MADTLKSHRFPSGALLEICLGDLTREPVDAIVNAANAHLTHGGGVAGAIARAGGEAIQRESDAWVREHGPVGHAQPAITGAGRLPCRFVIHAVGPVWGEGDEDTKLNAAITGSLTLAEERGFTSIAFSAISTGIFGFPRQRAAGIFLTAISDFLINNSQSSLRQVRLVMVDEETLSAFIQAFETAFRPGVDA